MEFDSRPAHVLTGSCTGCGHAFTMLEGAVKVGRPGQSEVGESSVVSDARSAGSSARSGPSCMLCGAPLQISASPVGLSAVCSGCSTPFEFVLRTDSERSEQRSRGPGRFREDRRGGPEGPKARPCRNCGGALQFSTSPDGLVTGTCASCGNRFTLPPRRNDGGRGRMGQSGVRGRYGSSPRGRAGWGRKSGRVAPRRSPGARETSYRRPDDYGSGEEEDARRFSRRRRDVDG
jgi:hypothetical protein